MQNFKVVEEAPPERKAGPHAKIDWKARLDQIVYVGRWFLIGKWSNLNSAGGFKRKLQAQFPEEFAFRAAQFTESNESKLYAMRCKERVPNK